MQKAVRFKSTTVNHQVIFFLDTCTFGKFTSFPFLFCFFQAHSRPCQTRTLYTVTDLVLLQSHSILCISSQSPTTHFPKGMTVILLSLQLPTSSPQGHDRSRRSYPLLPSLHTPRRPCQFAHLPNRPRSPP